MGRSVGRLVRHWRTGFGVYFIYPISHIPYSSLCLCSCLCLVAVDDVVFFVEAKSFCSSYATLHYGVPCKRSELILFCHGIGLSSLRKV